MENFDTEVSDSAKQLTVMREEGRGVYRRSISEGDAGKWAGSGFNSTNSSPASLVGNLLNDLSLYEKELGGDFGVSRTNQSGEEIMGVECSRRRVYGDFTDTKSQLRFSKVKQLHRRLQILEEDTETMKNEFFVSVDEYHQLLNEVSLKFYSIHQHLRIRMIGKESVEGALILGTDKGRTMRTGLLQVLHQVPNPFLVTRVKKADTFTLQVLLEACRNA